MDRADRRRYRKLHGCILLHGESYDLYEYFSRNAEEISVAAGDEIDLRAVGDFAHSGSNYKNRFSAAQLRRKARESEAYVRDVYQKGREAPHRRSEVEILREALGLQSTDLPCIAFTRRERPPVLGVLRIAAGWYESKSSIRAFGGCLRSWLRRDKTKSLATAHRSDSETGELLVQSLAGLTAEINERIVAGRGRDGSPRTLGAHAGSARLRIQLGTQQVFYAGVEVRVRPTPFRVLELLARSPGTLIQDDTLLKKASRRWGSSGDGPYSSKWAKENKLSLMKAFRGLIGTQGITRDEIERLISARNSCLVLNLSDEDVAVLK